MVDSEFIEMKARSNKSGENYNNSIGMMLRSN
jgi:hypothetical protein